MLFARVFTGAQTAGAAAGRGHQVSLLAHERGECLFYRLFLLSLREYLVRVLFLVFAWREGRKELPHFISFH